MQAYFLHALAMVRERTVAILLPPKKLGELDGIAQFMLHAMLKMSLANGSVSADVFDAMLHQSGLDETDVKRFVTRAGPDVVLIDSINEDANFMGVIAMNQEARQDSTRDQTSLFADWGPPVEKAENATGQGRNLPKAEPPTDPSMHHVMLTATSLFSTKGTTELKQYIHSVKEADLFRAYVQAAFHLVQQDSPLHKALEGVLQTL